MTGGVWESWRSVSLGVHHAEEQSGRWTGHAGLTINPEETAFLSYDDQRCAGVLEDVCPWVCTLPVHCSGRWRCTAVLLPPRRDLARAGCSVRFIGAQKTCGSVTEPQDHSGRAVAVQGSPAAMRRPPSFDGQKRAGRVSLGVRHTHGSLRKVEQPCKVTVNHGETAFLIVGERRCAAVLVEVFLGVRHACGSLRKVEQPCKVTVNHGETAFLIVGERRCAAVLVEVFLGVRHACGSLRKVECACTIMVSCDGATALSFDACSCVGVLDHVCAWEFHAREGKGALQGLSSAQKTTPFVFWMT
ncbi:uncharacterized protein WM277_009253 isoform 1-T4 [Molossus nigricans]